MSAVGPAGSGKDPIVPITSALGKQPLAEDALPESYTDLLENLTPSEAADLGDTLKGVQRRDEEILKTLADPKSSIPLAKEMGDAFVYNALLLLREGKIDIYDFATLSSNYAAFQEHTIDSTHAHSDTTAEYVTAFDEKGELRSDLRKMLVDNEMSEEQVAQFCEALKGNSALQQSFLVVPQEDEKGTMFQHLTERLRVDLFIEYKEQPMIASKGMVLAFHSTMNGIRPDQIHFQVGDATTLIIEQDIALGRRVYGLPLPSLPLPTSADFLSSPKTRHFQAHEELHLGSFFNTPQKTREMFAFLAQRIREEIKWTPSQKKLADEVYEALIDVNLPGGGNKDAKRYFWIALSTTALYPERQVVLKATSREQVENAQQSGIEAIQKAGIFSAIVQDIKAHQVLYQENGIDVKDFPKHLSWIEAMRFRKFIDALEAAIGGSRESWSQ